MLDNASQALPLAPMQWSSLPDIADVQPVSASDHACLDEIRDVLIRHQAIGRFGVHLMHKHFDVDPDEVLVEYIDIGARELHCKVEKRTAPLLGDSQRIETMWSFVGNKATRVCDQQCVSNYGHNSRHYPR